jgi:translation initiation factor 2A
MAQPQFFARTPKSVTLQSSVPEFKSLSGFTPADGARMSIYSANGKYFAYSTNENIQIVDPETGAIVQTFVSPNIIDIAFSPRGSYFMTWERPKREETSGNFAPNLRLWNVITGEYIRAFTQKNQAGWKLQFSFDEKYAARLVTNEVEFYDTTNFKSSWARLKVEGVSAFSLSPGQNYSVAVFTPEISGRPASVKVYQIPNFKQPVSQKTFFKAEKAEMKWNKLGTALLVLGSTEVDKSGKSYYGETNLYLLGIAGSYDSRIQLDKEGTIHDFTWSPNSREFGVVYGYMPSKTTIFDARGNVVHSFPVAPKNTLLFSPHGRFILVAGFGNLQGGVDIYDRQKQFVKVSSFEAANTVGCEWCPNGQYVLTSTTSPRLRVDNSIKLWHYTGKLIYYKEYPELFSAAWRPQDISLYPIRSTPDPAPEPHASAATAPGTKAGASTESKPKGAYVPPHARNRIKSPSSVVTATQFQKDFAAAAQATADANKPLSKTALKNKKKRENKKKAEEEKQDGTEPAESAAAPAADAQPVSTISPEEKKIRSLLKKLRAIQDLKVRQVNGDKLEDTQVKKIATEDVVRKELTSLGWSE